MKNIIKTLLRENLLKETIKSYYINDIDSDELYDSLENQARSLTKDGEISFGSADLFGVLLDGNILAGATWVDTAGSFSFHIIIKDEYRNKGYSKLLLDDLFKKYKSMSYRGGDFKIRVNVVNDKLVKTLAKHYGLNVIEDNGHGGVIMGN